MSVLDDHLIKLNCERVSYSTEIERFASQATEKHVRTSTMGSKNMVFLTQGIMLLQMLLYYEQSVGASSSI